MRWPTLAIVPPTCTSPYSDLRAAVCCADRDPGAFEKSRRAFAVDDDAKMFRLAQIFEPRSAIEDTLDRTDPGSDRRAKCILRVCSSFSQPGIQRCNTSGLTRH
jgi:hypothetical protein